MAIIKKNDNSECYQGCGKSEPSYIVGGNVKWVTLENSLPVPQKLNTELPKSNSIPRFKKRELKTHVHIKISTWMAALFIITKKWKQPRYPSTKQPRYPSTWWLHK